MKVLAFDTETTGLISNHSIALEHQPEVIEFYGAIVDLKTSKGPIKELHTLIKPRKYPMSQAVMEETKTKLTNEMLQDAPTFNEVADAIRNLVETSLCVIAHNVSFDREMLDIEFERMQQPVLQWPRLVCTVEQSIHLKGRRLNLTDLHTLLVGKPFPEAHRAKHDVMALIKCARVMHKRGML